MITHIGRTKVVDARGESYLEYLCVCPHCGEISRYGDMIKISGINCCQKCHSSLANLIRFDRAKRFRTYGYKAKNHLYEPHRYK